MEFLRRRALYFDVNATTPVSPVVRRRMKAVLGKFGGNPSAVYRRGRDAAAIIEAARAQVVAAIGAEDGQLLFTSGATEANNHVLRMLAAHAAPPRNRLVTSPVEHASVRAVAEHLATQGVEVVWLPVDRHGRVSPEDLAAVLDERVFLVSCMLANNELGTINPVRELAQLAHACGARFHCDCVQAAGKIAVDVGALDVDYATFSAHKLYGPKGIGVLWAREGAPVHAVTFGGHQQNGLRPGTEPTHDIAGCGAAFAGIADLLAQAPAVARRRDLLREYLLAAIPALQENSAREHAVPNTLNVRLPGVDNAGLLAYLDAHGIAVSAGSACSAQGNAASSVLLAVGLDDAAARESLRFSLGHDIRDGDVRFVAERVAAYARGDVPPIAMVAPGAVDGAFLADDANYLLDVRLGIERKVMKGIPGAHEIPFIGFRACLDKIPRDRRVLVVCTTGIDAMVVAWALKSRGHPQVAVLVGGVLAWHAARSGRRAPPPAD